MDAQATPSSRNMRCLPRYAYMKKTTGYGYSKDSFYQCQTYQRSLSKATENSIFRLGSYFGIRLTLIAYRQYRLDRKFIRSYSTNRIYIKRFHLKRCQSGCVPAKRSYFSNRRRQSYGKANDRRQSFENSLRRECIGKTVQVRTINQTWTKRKRRLFAN